MLTLALPNLYAKRFYRALLYVITYIEPFLCMPSSKWALLYVAIHIEPFLRMPSSQIPESTCLMLAYSQSFLSMLTSQDPSLQPYARTELLHMLNFRSEPCLIFGFLFLHCIFVLLCMLYVCTESNSILEAYSSIVSTELTPVTGATRVGWAR